MCDENVIDYKVVYGGAFSELEERVKEKLTEGWKLRGEIHQLANSFYPADSVYAQVMVRVADKTWVYTGASGMVKVQIPENTLYGVG
jgi:hypothetical protein